MLLFDRDLLPPFPRNVGEYTGKYRHSWHACGDENLGGGKRGSVEKQDSAASAPDKSKVIFPHYIDLAVLKESV